MRLRETGALGAAAAAAVLALSVLTSACDLSVDPMGVVRDTAKDEGGPGSANSVGEQVWDDRELP